MKNCVITVLLISVLILGGYIIYDKFITEENNNVDNNISLENSNVDIENNTKEEENTVIEKECIQDNGIKYYESSDSANFLTLLPEYNTKVGGVKGINESNISEFILKVGHGYNYDYLYGNYTIENNIIKLYVLSGCNYMNGSFTCNLPDNTNIIFTNDGTTEITLDYSEGRIMLGNIELNLK